MSDSKKPAQEDPLQTLGQRIRELRHETGLSQERFALSSGFDRTYIAGLEKGRHNISLRNLLRLAEAFGVDPAVLVEGLRQHPTQDD